jgi:sirohydrochlorin cobaltochelatase
MTEPHRSAVILCGHGTRDPDGVAQFEAFAAALGARHPGRAIAHGYLELSEPSFGAAIGALYRDGVREIFAVPVLLLTAGHVKRDIPDALNALQADHPGLSIRMGRPLGVSPGVIDTACHLAEHAAEQDGAMVPAETCLVVVGRGTSDPDANGDAAKLARIVSERLGFAFATVGYIAVTRPTFADALELVEHLPFPRVVVLPLVLFDGLLHKGIALELDAFRARSAKQWQLAAPFFSDDGWLATLDERIAEAESGVPTMNCQLCEYRHPELATGHEHQHHHHGHDHHHGPDRDGDHSA